MQSATHHVLQRLNIIYSAEWLGSLSLSKNVTNQSVSVVSLFDFSTNIYFLSKFLKNVANK